MYGTVATLKVKPGRADDFLALMQEWESDRKPKVAGAVQSLIYRLDTDGDAFIICAVFTDKAAYVANADDPEQDKWFRRMRELLVADPEWNDGEIVRSA